MTPDLRNAGYSFDATTNIWLRQGYAGIAYSDGEEVEQRIASIINEATDLRVFSSELRQRCTDWPSLYHLSGTRTNILRPFESELRGDILEIGAGCGAITRYLGECGGNVLALEGSPRRAAIARARTRDLCNVTVLSDKFDLFAPNEKFDVITLIGVFEYASLFTSGEEPALRMLEHVRTLLKPQGRLFIAIENQLGLKYLAGAPEDHLGQPMYGIEGRYLKHQPQTYGRARLSEMLERTGFSTFDFLAPFPDYKLPVSIIAEGCVDREEFDSAALAWQSVSRDPQLPLHLAFSLELAWPVVFENRLSIDLANSFLVVASPATQELISGEVLAYHYSTERHPEFCKQTVFRVDRESDRIVIDYKRIGGVERHRNDCAPIIRFVCPETEVYRSGRPMAYEFIRLVAKDDWSIEAIGDFLNRYLEILVKLTFQHRVVLDVTSPYSLLPGRLFDATASNLILHQDGSVALIDNEWELTSSIELGHLVFRMLLQLIGSIRHFGRTSLDRISRGEFVRRALESVQLSLTSADLDRYQHIEEQITEYVTGRPAKEAVRWWPDQALRVVRLQEAVSERDSDISNLAQAVSERDSDIANLAQAVSERDSDIANLFQAVAQRDGQIANLGQAAVACERRVEDLSDLLAERDVVVANLRDAAADLGARVTQMQLSAERHISQLAELKYLTSTQESTIAQCAAEVAALRESWSWRLTRPLRGIGGMLIEAKHHVELLRQAIRLGGGMLPTAKLAFSVLAREGVKGIAWRLENARALYDHDSVVQSRQAGQTIVAREGSNERHSVGQTTVREYVPLLKAQAPSDVAVKVVCFFLPQFHQIPENDAWWGQGFTEWTNVQPALPQFVGHYQPHIPIDVGYYNLLDLQVLRRQVELAKLYCVGGFCFYFYWFGGKRLLEAPIELYLDDKSLDLPFCLCWANENWSRRWDGLDAEILIAQQHSPEDDIAFIAHIARYMRDPRYIRINGKPLLVVYRPRLLPSPLATAERWRNWCRQGGLGEIYLAYTQSFESVDPATYGFDAAIEFPPNNSGPPNVTSTVTPLGDQFASTIYDFSIFVERSDRYVRPEYPLFRSVCPSWDNTARRKNSGTVFVNSSPGEYERWLRNAVADTKRSSANPDERLLFVNAWNEWAEGAHLEPDARYGYAWLQATRNALTGEDSAPAAERRIVLVAHDAHPHGAQMLAANLARTLAVGMGFHVDLVCLGDGPLLSEYAKWSSVHCLAGVDPRGPEARALAATLYRQGQRSALINTTVSGHFLETLAKSGIACVALIHELKGVIENGKLNEQAKAIAAHALRVVFPAVEVAESFCGIAPVQDDRIVIRPQGLYKRTRTKNISLARANLREMLHIDPNAQVVLGVGYADYRKGVDLFVAAGIAALEHLPDAYWVWVGHWEPGMRQAVETALTQAPGARGRFIFPGLQAHTEIFFQGADIFALTSREDPFPSVVLEALDAGIPVVGFEGAGGFVRLLSDGCGRIVPMESVPELSKAVVDLLVDQGTREKLGSRGAEVIAHQYSFRRYVFDLLDLLDVGLHRVSAIVPNYNYAHYLSERLESIIRQDYPIYEIIFLDDHSVDDSIAVAERILANSDIDYAILKNSVNSGSVFRQWQKGVENASGTHVWIAEADDACEPSMISELLLAYSTPGVVLSYCESTQWNEAGTVMADNYLDYVADVDSRRWLTPFVMDGQLAITEYLSVKNTIPNVSAVLFNAKSLKQVLASTIDDICRYRVAGDWRTYIDVLRNGRLAFTSKPLNKHRRHSSGVTLKAVDQAQLDEIKSMQSLVQSWYVVPECRRRAADGYLVRLAKEHVLH